MTKRDSKYIYIKAITNYLQTEEDQVANTQKFFSVFREDFLLVKKYDHV